MTLLEVEGLHVVYEGDPDVHAVRGVTFSIDAGETLGIVGESGCGKTTVAQAVMRSLPPNGHITDGSIRFDGQDLLTLSDEELRTVRWQDMAMITQSAMNSLNPVYTVGTQIREAIQAHTDVGDAEANDRARELLELVGIDADRVDDYPHQLSGGMRQRAIIGMSLALDPKLLLADEPTTALDVIVQGQILYRLKQLQRELGSSMLMITHDISVVAETCDTVVVMYGGEVMEAGPATDIFNDPHHPYTLGLQNAFPNIEGDPTELVSIPGAPPDLSADLAGCPFESRCPFATWDCRESLPETGPTDEHRVYCHEPTSYNRMQSESRRRETWLETQR